MAADGSSDPVLSFVEAVCRRPTMYTPTGSFLEVVSFLHGFYCGMGSHNLDPDLHAYANDEWSLFVDWLGVRLRGEGDEPCETFRTFRRSFSDPENGLSQMAAAYRLYRAGKAPQQEDRGNRRSE